MTARPGFSERQAMASLDSAGAAWRTRYCTRTGRFLYACHSSWTTSPRLLLHQVLARGYLIRLKPGFCPSYWHGLVAFASLPVAIGPILEGYSWSLIASYADSHCFEQHSSMRQIISDDPLQTRHQQQDLSPSQLHLHLAATLSLHQSWLQSCSIA